MSELIFTPASVLDLLLQIDELSEYDIGLTETIDGKIQLQIGNSYYELDDESAEEVSVDESVIDTISDVNEETYEDLSYEIVEDTHFNENEYIENENEYIESGIIGELAKSLLLGGMVRLSAKLLK